jgi:hypothetical protein
VVVLVILAVVAALASRMATRRSAERRNLGPEYRRLADEAGTRTANAQYDKRRRRVDKLDIKPLSPEQRTLYSAQWVAAQEAFITSPAQSVQAAAVLVTAVAAERGYEVAETGQLLVDLSVYYGDQLEGYRSALATTEDAGDTATEGLRQAMLDYRAMFCALAEIGASDEMAAVTAAAATTGAGGAAAQATDGTPEAG